MSENKDSFLSSLAVGRLVLFALLLSLGCLVLYKFYQDKRGGDYSSIPQKLQLNYVQSDLNFDIDRDRALEVLSDPGANRKEFNALVYDINISVLDHVTKRMGLSSSLREQARREYEKHHPYLRDLYYRDFITIKDTTANLYETWYSNEATNSTEILKEVASKYTCFFVNHAISTMLETDGGSIYAKGMNVETPCGVALSEALQPMMQRLQERAAIRDFSRSRGMMKEKIERVIAELATMEQRNQLGLNKKLQTKIWGYAVSTTDIEVSAISIVKVGFKLDRYFKIDLNDRSGVVTVSLPEPVILSHEVYPRFDKLDIGWLREVKDADLNRAFNTLRGEFRQQVRESDLKERSKGKAVELMNTMFTPLLQSMNKRYRLKVVFADPEENVEQAGRISKEFAN